MNPVIAAAVVIGLLALGEVISILTKAKVPGILVTVVALFVLLQFGLLPADIVGASTLAAVGALLQPVILVHMGTLIPMRILKQQYKSVAITVLGMFFATVLIIGVVTPIFGWAGAVAGIGPLNGGLVAYVVTADALTAAGLTSLIAVPLVIFILHSVIGMPITINLLRRRAKTVVRERSRQFAMVGAGGGGVPTGTAANPIGADSIFADSGESLLLPKRFMESNTILLFLIFVAGAAAVGLGMLTGISSSVFALIIGVIAAFFRVLPQRALEQANGYTISMIGLLAIVLSAIAGISLTQILSVLPMVLVIIGVGILGLMIGGYIGSKIFKWDPFKGIPVALTALLGFPLDYIIVQEVARSVGKDPEERDAILTDLVAPMIVGGFVAVSFGSVLIASFLVTTL